MSAKLWSQPAIGNVITPTPEVLLAWHTDAYPHGIRRRWMPAYAIPLVAVSTLLVALRLTLRMRKTGGGFGLDDAFLIPSWLLLIAFTIVIVWSSESGTLDRHMWDVVPSKYPTVALSAWLGQLIFLTGTCLIRISILLFHRRMVKGTFKRRWRYSVWVAIGFTATWTAAFCIMLLATCTPVEATWKVYDPTYTKDWKCGDTRDSSFAAGVLACLSDCYALVLPWAMIWPLEMPRRQKILLNMVFGFGVVVVVAAGLRTKHAVALGKDYDSTWVGFWVYFWTLLEWNLAIICCCAPSMRAFFKEYLKDSVDKALNSFSNRSKYRETNKSATASQHNIELRRTYTVASEKPFNPKTSVQSKDDEDASSTSSTRHVLDTVVEVPQANARDATRSPFQDPEGNQSQLQFAPWSAKIDSSCSGPDTNTAAKPYGQV